MTDTPRIGAITALLARVFASDRRCVWVLLGLSLILVRFYFASGDISWSGDGSLHPTYAALAAAILRDGDWPMWTFSLSAGSPFLAYAAGADHGASATVPVRRPAATAVLLDRTVAPARTKGQQHLVWRHGAGRSDLCPSPVCCLGDIVRLTLRWCPSCPVAAVSTRLAAHEFCCCPHRSGSVAGRVSVVTDVAGAGQHESGPWHPPVLLSFQYITLAKFAVLPPGLGQATLQEWRVDVPTRVGLSWGDAVLEWGRRTRAVPALRSLNWSH